MTPAQNARFWLIALVVFILVVWALSPMLLPFVAALAIAYFLNPAVNALGRFNMGRGFAALIILLAFTLLVVLVSALVLPLINAQLVELVGAIPGYATRIRNHFQPLINEWLAHLSPHDLQKIEGAMTQYAGDVVSWVGAVLRHVLSGGMAIFDLLMLLVVTPVVAFYLMRDWPHFVAAVDDIINRRHKMGPVAHQIKRDHRRDHQQHQQIENRHAARQHMPQHGAHPADNIARILGHGAFNFLQIVR